MKLPHFILAASLVGNAALAFVLLRRHEAPNSSPPSATSVAAVSAVPTSPASPTVASVPSGTFAELATGDINATVARLRADGVSPRMLRAIVSGLIAQRFADRHQALVDAILAKPWWQGESYEAYQDPKITAMRRQLARDEHNALYELLGPEEPETEFDRAWSERRYGGISAAKQESIRQINGDYDDLMAEVRERAHGIILPEDRAKLAYLEQQKRADVAKLLSPDELATLDLHSSPTANNLRKTLNDFDPTEDEFRALFKIQQGIDTQFGEGKNQNLSQDDRRQKRDLTLASVEQARAVLTPDRFAQYQVVTDPAYRGVREFVTEQQLPLSAAAPLVVLKNDMSAKMQAVMTDSSLSATERSDRLGALAQLANSTVVTQLGADGAARYKQENPGQWLNNLERRAQARPKGN